MAYRPEALSATVREVRSGSGLSLSRAARRAGIGKATLSAWERRLAKPRLVELKRLLDALDASDPARSAAYTALDLPPPTLAAHLPVLADLLQGLREGAGVGQRALARRLGFAHSTVSRWESGATRPDEETRRRVADALGATPEWRAALLAAEPAPVEPFGEAVPRLDRLLPPLHDYDEATIDLTLHALRARLLPLAASGPGWRALFVELHEYAALTMMGRNHTARLAWWVAAGRAWEEPLRMSQLRMLGEYAEARRMRGRRTSRWRADCLKAARRLERAPNGETNAVAAWRWRSVARYLVWAGEAEAADAFYARAYRCADVSEIVECHSATVFEIATGRIGQDRPEAALSLLTEGETLARPEPGRNPLVNLREAEALLCLGERSAAEAAYARGVAKLRAAPDSHRQRAQAYLETAAVPVARALRAGALADLPFLEI